MYKIANTKGLVYFILKSLDYKVNVALDMTLGNGYDTKLIEEVCKPNKIYAFDIQEIAINKSKERLKAYKNIEYILDCHSNFTKYIDSKYIDLAIFNLGYLPSGDHNITTNYKKVISALEILLTYISKDGIIIITLYPGHAPGYEEKIFIEKYLKNIDQNNYNIMKYEFINQKNHPPYVITITRK